jgi:hypothetical protein
MKKKNGEPGARAVSPMTRVKILMSIAGLAAPEYGLEEFAFQPGQILELETALAARWIAGGIAEAAPEPEPQATGKEYAVREPPERRKI